MLEYIGKQEAITLIEEKQKQLCPLGRFSRNATYGSDRDAFDSWQEIIDAFDAIPAADVTTVRRGRWIPDGKEHVRCTNCGHGRNIRTQIGWNFCPSCGARMGGEEHEAD